MSENEIGQMFDASRTPVREAFAKLREDGMIETRPSRGTFVSMLSESQIRSAQFIREAIEVAMVERLCEMGLSDDVSKALTLSLAMQRTALEADAKLEFQRLDDEFHGLLAEATGMPRIKSALTREKFFLDRLRVLALNDSMHMSQLLTEHQNILTAIQAQDPVAAVGHVRTHLRAVLSFLTQLVETNSDYFDKSES